LEAEFNEAELLPKTKEAAIMAAAAYIAASASDEGMTPRSSIFAYLVHAKEEARSKDTRSPQGPAHRLAVEGKNTCKP
jgi:hypothetical protein